MPKLALAFDVLANDKGASRTLDRLGDKSEHTSKRIGKSFAVLAGSITGAFAGVKIVDFLHDSISAASDLNESASKSKAVFGAASKSVEAFASTSAKSMGQSKQATLEATATFGNLFRALNIGVKPAASMSERLVTLAGDLASFNNVSPDEALLALRSGLLGEAEPLRKFGVSLSQTRIEAEALSDGLVKPTVNMDKLRLAQRRADLAQRNLTDAVKKHGKTSKEAQSASIAYDAATQNVAKAMQGQKTQLTAAQKAQAAYNIILKDTKLAQGDFGRTSGGLANQQRILSAQITDVKAKLGTQLLPVMVDLAKFANNEVVPAISSFVDGMQSGQGAGGQFADAIGQVGDGLDTAWKVGKPFLGFIADHPKLFTEIALGAGAFATAIKVMGAVKKLPGLGSLASKAAPLPVFVTNSGFGTGLPGRGGKGLPPVVTGPVGKTPLGRGGPLPLAFPNIMLPKDLSGLQKQVFDLGVGVGKLTPEMFKAAKAAGLLQERAGAKQEPLDAAKALEFYRKYGTLTDANTKKVIALLAAAAKADPVRKKIAADTARDTANNVKLISGGLLTVKDLASTTSGKVSRDLTTGLGGGISKAKDRVDELNSHLAGLKQPKIDPAGMTKPLSQGVDKAHEFLLELGKIPGSKVVNIRAQVTTSGRSIKLGSIQSDGKVLFIKAEGGKQLLADGGWVLGPGTATSDSVPLMGSRGEFMLRQKVASKYPRQVEALNAGVPLERLSGGGGNSYDFSTVVHATTNADPHQIAATVQRKQRNRMFLAGLS